MTYLGLRPGEKLYEELLVKTEELDKTPNSMIFIERDAPLCEHDINVKLEELQAASMTRFIMSLEEAVDLVLFAFEHGEKSPVGAKNNKQWGLACILM